MAPFRRAHHTIRSATTLARTRPAYAAGLRASLATVIPLAAGQLLELGGAGTWMSLAGFNASLSDRGGSYGTRATTMATLTATGALAAVLGTLAGGHLVASLLATFLVAFIASLLRVWGNPGISVGGATLTVYVVALAIPAAHPQDAFVRAAFVIVGGCWAMGIALVIWPLRPYRPARLAIVTCYEALADYVSQAADAVRSQHTAEWAVQLTPAAATIVRTALENAGQVLVQQRLGRPGLAERAERLLVLAELADQIFGHVVALGEILAALRGDARIDSLHEQSVLLLGEAATTARQIADGVESEDGATTVSVSWSGEPLRAAMRALSTDVIDPQYAHAATILDRAAQFASAAAVSVEALNGGGPDPDALAAVPVPRMAAADEPAARVGFLESLRATLSPGSLILRFALRVAVVTTIAVASSELLELKRGYWVTITVIVILQPYTGVTLTRAVQRVLGTVLGALLAAALGTYFHDPRAILVIATVFVACCVALLPVNYAAFSVFLTPTFVLLAEASAGDWNLAETRVMNTLLGGALALAGSRFLWPSPERTRFPTYAAAALRADAQYLSTVVSVYDDRGREAGETVRGARRSVGLATVNAEESLQRALTEAHGDSRTLAPALTCLAYIRRFTASVAALALARYADGDTTQRALEPFRAAVVATLTDLAQALEEARAPQPLPLLYSATELGAVSPLVKARTDRLSRQVRTLHDAVERMTTRA